MDTPLNQRIVFSNTQGVTSMAHMFLGATAFNQPIDFDATSVTEVQGMFYAARSFNQMVILRNSRNVTNANGMFGLATVFNSPLIMQTDSVVSMILMFAHALYFNQPLNFNTSRFARWAGCFWERPPSTNISPSKPTG